MDYKETVSVLRSIPVFASLDTASLKLLAFSSNYLSLEDGEAMERILAAEGVPTGHYSILVEEAVRDRDLIIAPDGVAGNLMFRTLHFLGGGRSYGAPIVNLPKVFVDTSRAKTDYSNSVLLAAGLAQVGCRA